MSRRRGARPVGRGVPYSVPGHVIGGSEPKSWRVSRQAKRAWRLAANKRAGKPVSSGAAISAKRQSNCYWCGELIKPGQTISPAKVSGRTRWLHAGCTVSPTGTKSSQTAQPAKQQGKPISVGRLLRVWETQWGKLREPYRSAFLEDPRAKAIAGFGESAVAAAVSRSRKLDDILEELR